MALPSSSDSIFILLDSPTNLEFGIDCITYELGQKFSGISLLPSGLHFIYHSHGIGSIRQGYFTFVNNNDIIINTWDKVNEEILPNHKLSNESYENLVNSIKIGQLNDNLGPYPVQQYHIWKNNTNFIDYNVLNRANCLPNTIIYPGDNDDDQIINDIKLPSNKSNLSYYTRTATFINIKTIEMKMIENMKLSDNNPSELTSMMMDKSTLLKYLLEHYYNNSWTEILGEMQLSFMLFMLLYSYPALNHWKNLIYIISSSEKYLQYQQNFTNAFMRVLYSQLNFAPNDFFENELSTLNFLRPTITILFSSLSPSSISNNNDSESMKLSSTLLEHKKRLKLFLEKKFSLFTSGYNSISSEQVYYNEEDLYNIAEEDLPTFVSNDEIQQFSHINNNTNNLMIYNDNDKTNQRLISPIVHSSITTTTTTTTTTTDNLNTLSIHDFQQRCNINDHQQLQERWSHIDNIIQQSSDYNISNTSTINPYYDKNNMNNDVTINTDYNIIKNEVNPQQNNIEIAETVSKLPNILTSIDKEKLLFCWRYPALYDYMELTNGREDMTMTAMRIIDEVNNSINNSNNNNKVNDNIMIKDVNSMIDEQLNIRYDEAIRFIEYELPKRILL